MTHLKETCPFCDSQAEMKKELREIQYRGEAFTVTAHFYACQGCGEAFTTTPSDTLTMGQVYDRYRAKHRIPFQEDIVRIREKYGLSARKMSEVLGLGINGFNNYENGEMPSQAIGNLIATVEDPEVFYNLAMNARELFTDTQWQKLTQQIRDSVLEEQKVLDTDPVVPMEGHPDEYSGFRLPDLGRISQLVIFFLINSDPGYNDRLKMNKLLFYTDFVHFKYHGRSITGLSYRAIPYGPVPSSYDRLFSWLEQRDIIQIKWDHLEEGAGRERFVTQVDPEKDIFSDDEWESISAVIDKFGALSSWEVVDISHEERAWQELNASRKLISYPDYAFDLKAL